ncbi:fumarylacetoacetate hydrolase family protein [Bacillus shivajii]|uniref:fumarylacetoacetate hydrolase family protein n=1 Tax=Bacillus shivajii TaxID=1983719 RepID=UPI001CFA0A5B|nr:fumarylacetoacetate hydrolase family protein [Bacillus shivajii]UCZ52028.1 fumarylacetoacetate hydrolase family protein [Bacillus shivajii]
MKFASFTYEGQWHYGFVHEQTESLVSLSVDRRFPRSMLEFLQDDLAIKEAKHLYAEWLNDRPNGFRVKMTDSSFEWKAPIPRPSKNVFAVGRNYLDHAKEMGSTDAPNYPVIFSKAATSVTGYESEVSLHKGITESVDYEGELAVVIGKEGTHIQREQAMDHIFGFTIANDVTARDLQKNHQQFLLGKSLNTFCPVGPWIVTKDEFLPYENKKIITSVNGETRQLGMFDQMIFSIPQLIETLSQGITLEPGDIIATGTPKGVGKGFHPPKFLRNGDVVEITIEGLGTLRNTFK